MFGRRVAISGHRFLSRMISAKGNQRLPRLFKRVKLRILVNANGLVWRRSRTKIRMVMSGCGTPLCV